MLKIRRHRSNWIIKKDIYFLRNGVTELEDITMESTMTMGSNENMTTPYFDDEYVYDQSDVIINFVLASIIGFCGFFGVIGNSLVVICWAMSKKLQNITNIFVISLSITDFLGCSMLPIQVYTFVDFANGPPVPDWVCRMCGAICLIAFKSSVCHLALIGINRYVVITRFRAQYLRLYSVRNVLFMVIFAWTFPTLLIMLPPAVGLGHLGYNAGNQLCVFDGTPLQLRIIYILEEILFGLSFIIIVTCYFRIYVYISRQHRDLIKIYSKRERSSGRLSIPSCITEVTETTDVEPSTSSNVYLDAGTNSPSSRKSVKSKIYTINVKSRSESKKRRRTASSQEMHKVLTKREIDITKNLFMVVCCFFFFVFPHILCLTTDKCYNTNFKYTATILVINSLTNPLIYCLKHPTFREVSSCLFRGDLSGIPKPARWLKRLLNK